MRVIFAVLTLISAIYTDSTQAALGLPPGHAHTEQNPIVREEALDISIRILEKLIEKGFIANTWHGQNAISVEKNNTGKEWQIRFDNSQETDPAKRSVYIFLTITGEYIAANFTGK